MNISIFGSAQPTPQDALYQQAVLLGRLLGEAGHNVITGGYCGTMEAVSRGAFEVGARVVGVTCDEIENYRPTGPNALVKEEWRTATLPERILVMIKNSMASIALPGVVGTLTEIMLTWNHMVIHAIPTRPLILVGNGWRQTFQTLFGMQHQQLPDKDRHLLVFCDTVKDAADLISRLASPKK